MINIRKFFNGLNIVPRSDGATAPDSQGDLAVSSADGKLYYNNGTTSSPILTGDNSGIITNKLLQDSTVWFVDASDNSKAIKFDAAGTTATSTTLLSTQTANRILSLPDSTDTLIARNTTDTLTNKSISGSTNTLSNIANASLSNMAAHTFKGNNTGSSAAPLDLTATQLTAELNNFVGDSGSGGTKGLVPAPASGDAAASKFLKADGTWSTTPGTTGANTALSNLALVAINTSLLPGVSNSINLGSASFVWLNSYINTANILGSMNINGLGSWSQGVTATDSIVYDTALQSGLQKNLAITTTAGGSLAKSLGLYTGNAASGNSGDIIIQTGTSPATRGIVQINGSAINANSNQIHNVTNPTSAQDAATKAYVDSQVAYTPPNSEVWITDSNNDATAYGTTNTFVRRFLTTTKNTGSDITYADSATLGGSWTINTTGTYSIYYSEIFVGDAYMTLVVNGSEGSTAVQSITNTTDVRMFTSSGGNGDVHSGSVSLHLTAGDVIWAQTSGNAIFGTASFRKFCSVRITRLS